jgi:uncharacterized protein with PIN domain
MAKSDGILLHRLKALRSHLQSAALVEAQKRVEDACLTFATTANEVVDIPRCPQCGREMGFNLVASYDTDHNERTFECAPCQYTQCTIVRRVSSLQS